MAFKRDKLKHIGHLCAAINYSAADRSKTAHDVDNLIYLRSEIVRTIERRRELLIADRDLSLEMVDLLEGFHRAEYQTRDREGKTMPDLGLRASSNAFS